MRFFRKIFFSTAAVFAAVFPLLVFAQTTINYQIPGAQAYSATNPCTTIINFYWFALLVSGILAFGAIVWGGIKYAMAAGNPSGQSEGKEWIMGALLGILLLAGSYFVLNIINPALVTCTLPTLSALPQFSAPSSGGVNNGASSGGAPSVSCQSPSTGPCSNLQAYSGSSCFGNSINTAAGVCNVESNGDQYAKSGTDLAADGSPASIGLFQINISANQIGNLNCPAAFEFPITGTTIAEGRKPNIVDPSLYNECVAAAEDPATNIAAACQVFRNGGSNYSQWGPSTRSACGL